MSKAGVIASHGRISKVSGLSVGSFGRLYKSIDRLLLLFYGILRDRKLLSTLTDDEKVLIAEILDGSAILSLSDRNVVATLIRDGTKITATLSNGGNITLVISNSNRNTQLENTTIYSTQISDGLGI